MSLLALVHVTVLAFSQKPNFISLSDALEGYVYNTVSVRKGILAYANSLLEYGMYKKSLLPAMELSLSPISFNHSMQLLQDYQTGERYNVAESFNCSVGGLKVSQRVIPTGGVLSLGTSLSWLRDFSNGNDNFTSSPLYVSYSQQALGGGRSLSYERQIQERTHSLAEMELCQEISMEQVQILNLYLDACLCKEDLGHYGHLREQNDTLAMLVSQKVELGKATRLELEELELQRQDNSIRYESARQGLLLSTRKLAEALGISELSVSELPDLKLPSFLSPDEVMMLYSENNPDNSRREIERLKMTRDVHETKVKNSPNATISVTYGLNQYGKKLGKAFERPNRQQQVIISMSIPMFQWGLGRDRKAKARNDMEILRLEHQGEMQKVACKVRQMVMEYNACRSLLENSRSHYRLRQRYHGISLSRYSLGKISWLDLMTARRELQKARQEYMTVLRNLYVGYFDIRHLTMYDFVRGQPLRANYLTVKRQKDEKRTKR